MKPRVYVSGGFDDLRSRQMRFLEEASRLGELHVLLWADEAIERAAGSPRFPLAERRYCIESLRSVADVRVVDRFDGPRDLLRAGALRGDLWAIASGVGSAEPTPAALDEALEAGIGCRRLSDGQLAGFPRRAPANRSASGPRVVVTGTFDWLHSGHIRFFEEASSYGRLLVVVGHDANIRLLKGAGHPLLGQEERVYMAGAVRFVDEAILSSGTGWLDAEPELRASRPDLYVVNEDGDRPEKRDFCRLNGIHYLVLKRTPKDGLPRRASTDLRGF